MGILYFSSMLPKYCIYAIQVANAVLDVPMDCSESFVKKAFCGTHRYPILKYQKSNCGTNPSTVRADQSRA
jgi:hypothetical protein